MYKETIERITEFFAKGRYLPELQAAKEGYFARTGKVFEDDPMYENRMNAFLEWFIFDRTLEKTAIPPVRLYAEMFDGEASEEERTSLRQLEHTNHSLFEFVSGDSSKIRLKDLFDGKTYVVEARPIYSGIRRGDILDARLLTLGETQILSDPFWVHPLEVRTYILSEVKKVAGTSREKWLELLLELADRKLKSERYRHLKPESIYSENPVVGEAG